MYEDNTPAVGERFTDMCGNTFTVTDVDRETGTVRYESPYGATGEYRLSTFKHGIRTARINPY